MGVRYENCDRLNSHFLTSIVGILHSRWNVFMVSQQQVQHLFVVCFGSVAKPSFEFICHDEDCYMFTRAMEVCRNSADKNGCGFFVWKEDRTRATKTGFLSCSVNLFHIATKISSLGIHLLVVTLKLGKHM